MRERERCSEEIGIWIRWVFDMVYFNLRSENFDWNSPITSQLARSQICGYVCPGGWAMSVGVLEVRRIWKWVLEIFSFRGSIWSSCVRKNCISKFGGCVLEFGEVEMWGALEKGLRLWMLFRLYGASSWFERFTFLKNVGVIRSILVFWYYAYRIERSKICGYV